MINFSDWRKSSTMFSIICDCCCLRTYDCVAGQKCVYCCCCCCYATELDFVFSLTGCQCQWWLLTMLWYVKFNIKPCSVSLLVKHTVLQCDHITNLSSAHRSTVDNVLSHVLQHLLGFVELGPTDHKRQQCVPCCNNSYGNDTYAGLYYQGVCIQTQH